LRIEDRGELARARPCVPLPNMPKDQLGATEPADQINYPQSAGVVLAQRGLPRSCAFFTTEDAELSEPAFKSYSVSVRNAGQTLPVGTQSSSARLLLRVDAERLLITGMTLMKTFKTALLSGSALAAGPALRRAMLSK